MKSILKNISNKAKTLLRNTKLFKRIGIFVLCFVAMVVLVITGLYFYLQYKYPEAIVLEGAYYDISSLDIQFSDRDISGTYNPNDAVKINVFDNIIECDANEKLSIENKVIEINSSGTYVLSGSLKDGMIIVSAGEEDKVQLVFNNFDLSNSSNPAIYIRSADKVFLTTAEKTINTVSDGKGYTYTDGDNNVDAAIFSKTDLTLNGFGELIVTGNTAHGIVSKDDLVIGCGAYRIESVKKALNGKDCVKVYSCEMTLHSGTDGICSDNTEDTERGYIYIKNGKIDIISGNDGIQAENVLVLDSPDINITSGGGSINAPNKESDKAKGRHEEESEVEEESTESIKGFKSAKDIVISAGTYTIDSYDDSVHADHSIKISGGEFCIKSGDDAIHAEHTLQITNGSIEIEKSFEGLEAYQIAINGGDIHIIASDDGINAASESTAITELTGLFAMQTMGKLEITDGTLLVNSEGDSLDSNGVFTISGGVVLVAGPQNGGGGDGIVDCDGRKTVNGGIILCIGKSNSRFGDSDDYFDTERQLQIIKSVGTHSAGTVIEMQDSKGSVLATLSAPKNFDLIVATAEGLNSESDYVFFLDGIKCSE